MFDVFHRVPNVCFLVRLLLQSYVLCICRLVLALLTVFIYHILDKPKAKDVFLAVTKAEIAVLFE